MKRNKLFYLATAALSLSFAACSENTSLDVITPDKATSFAKVQVAMAGGAETRAIGDDGFDRGTKEEAEVKSLTLLFYDETGNLVGAGSTNQFSDPDRTGNTAADNVSDAHKTSIVQVRLIPKSAAPKTMVAYVNADASFATLNDAYAFKTTDLQNAAKNFIMTNSGYYEGSEWKVAVTVSLDDLYDTEEAAKASNVTPISIYVERLAAKVTVSQSLEEKDRTADLSIFGVDDTEYQIVFEPKKWAATGTAPEMYAFKKSFDHNLTWANPTRQIFRSYWAEGVYYDTDYLTYATNNNPLKYLSANQILYKSGTDGKAFGTDTPAYVTEHTYGENGISAASFEPAMSSTSAIVVGQYKVTGNNAEKFTNNDFFLTVRGANSWTILNKSELIARLVALHDQIADKNTSSTPLAESEYANYLDVQKDGAAFKLVAKAGKELVWLNSSNPATFTKTVNAIHYKNGWAYFFVPIEHNYSAGKETEVGAYGVVRNHSYQLSITKITGRGTPLDDDTIGDDPENTEPDPENPDEPGDNPIIPTPEDVRDAVINATLNVLSWQTVQQKVEL